MKKTKMAVLTRNHIDGLTLAQQSAIDLLVAGKTDTEAATLLSLHRTTITKWRLYSPDFQADPEPIAYIELASGPMRPVYEDDLGQYVIDDFGRRIAGVWYIPDLADEPTIVTR